MVSRAGFVDARDLAHALSTLGEHGSDVTVLAGGTDVMVQYLRGDIRPRVLLHVRRLPELRGLHRDGRTLVGAATTHWQLATDVGIGAAHPSVAEAAATVGGRQTQNVGTVGGNVVNASPAADLLPALMVNDARVTLVGPSSERELPVADFVVGRRATLREPEELVKSLTLEAAAPGSGETYLKVGRRAAMEVAVVGLAARLTFDGDGAVTDARIAVCSVAPRPFRARESERRVLGTRLQPVHGPLTTMTSKCG